MTVNDIVNDISDVIQMRSNLGKVEFKVLKLGIRGCFGAGRVDFSYFVI